MASPVIQSVSSTTWTEASSPVVITKPTGLAAGDMMLAFILSSYDGGSGLSAPTTPAGWAVVGSYDVAGTVVLSLRVFAKEASAGDAAASNFSFTVDSSNVASIGSMYRITGGVPSAPFATTATDDDTADDVTLSFSFSLNTLIPDALIFAVFMGRDGAGTHTLSGYTVSGTNPTWTEHLDAAYDDTISHNIGIATATIATPRTLTTAQATASAAISDAYLFIASLAPVTPVSITPASVALRVQQSAPTKSAVVNITPASIAVKVAQSAPTTKDNDNPWSNASKPSTTWTNPDKI